MQGWLLLDQARSQRRLGWAGKAADLYRAALPLLPEGERARIYRELALTLLSRRDLAGAAAALQEGLSLTDATSFAAALLRAEQARLAQFEGRFAEVEPALLEVLSSWEERYQPYHPLCLRLREVLVELCILRRDWATGLQRARQLVVLANQDPTCCAPRVARGLYWMAMVWLYQGDRESAKQALYQAQLLWDSWLDLWDVERAQIGYGSGLVTMDEMEFYKAEDYVRKACDMVEQGFSEQSVALGFFFTGLAEIHKVTGRERQAQEVSQRAQELLRPKR
jgi:tetratricopeptide (TPR) repeat protein